MEPRDFDELLQGVREMKAIRRGQMKPARITRLKPESPQVVRQECHFAERGSVTRSKQHRSQQRRITVVARPSKLLRVTDPRSAQPADRTAHF